jgi:CxxC motif-containing protein (DUF1111 family)
MLFTMKYPFFNLFLCACLLFGSCYEKDNIPVATATDAEEFSGGANGTTFDFSENAFGVSVKGLNGAEEGYFVTGNSFFRTNWVSAPSSVQSIDGLGPVMNALSCGSCHFKDGRAKPPGSADEALNGLLFRLSVPGMDVHGGPLPEPNYGGQLQDKAIQQVLPEAKVRVSYTSLEGTFPDGTYSLRNPVYTFESLNYGPMAADWMFSPRIAPQMPGLGLLEVVSE